MLYRLSSSMLSRMNLDEMLNLSIEENYRASGGAEMSLEDHFDIKDAVYDSLNITIIPENVNDADDSSCTYVDDLDEARSRFDNIYSPSLLNLMVDELTDKLYREERGFTGCVTVFNDGQQDGLPYDSTDVEYVLLDGERGEVCYRYSDNNQNYDWQIGSVGEMVEEAFTWYEETTASTQAQREDDDRQARIREQLYLAEMEASRD